MSTPPVSETPTFLKDRAQAARVRAVQQSRTGVFDTPPPILARVVAGEWDYEDYRNTPLNAYETVSSRHLNP